MIYNTNEQLKEAVRLGIILPLQAVAIGYQAYEARSAGGSCWQVWSPYFHTDPDAAWYNYHRKTFNVIGRADKKEKLQLAMEWASNQYGIKEWAANRFREYVPKAVQDKLPIPKQED